MRKRILSLLVGAIVASSFVGMVGCGDNPATTKPTTTPPTPEVVNLKLWGSQEQQVMLGEMVEAFKAANPDKTYNITLGVVSEADALGTLKTDVSAGADVYAFANDQIIELYRAGALAKVGGANLEAIKSENGAGAVNAAKVGEDVYAYPFSADNGYFLYYDSTKVTHTDTLEGILADCAAAGAKLCFDLDNSWYDASFFFGTGCTYSVNYDADGGVESVDCDFDDPVKGMLAGKAMLELKANSAFLNGGDDELKAGFADGSVAAAVSGTWNAATLQSIIGEGYAAVKLPTFTVDGQTFQMSSFAGYKLYGVNPTSKSLGEAHKLAAFLSGEAMQMKRFETFGTGPSNTVVAQSDAVKADLALAALAAQGAHAVAQTAVPSNYWSAVESFGREVCQGMVNNENLATKLTQMAELIRESK
ncbi:MAG: extracellular solute-binding protein [Christensenellaceae bacterium]